MKNVSLFFGLAFVFLFSIAATTTTPQEVKVNINEYQFSYCNSETESGNIQAIGEANAKIDYGNREFGSFNFNFKIDCDGSVYLISKTRGMRIDSEVANLIKPQLTNYFIAEYQ